MAQISRSKTWIPGDVLTSGDLNNEFNVVFNGYNAHDIAANGVHGITSGAIVGTQETQTLTNKTLTSPVITGTIDLTTGPVKADVTGTYLHVSKNTGSLPSINSSTAIVASRPGASSTDCNISIIAGTTGDSILYFGDADTESVGYMYYNHSNDVMFMGASGGTIATLTSSGLDLASSKDFSVNTGQKVLFTGPNGDDSIRFASGGKLVFEISGSDDITMYGGGEVELAYSDPPASTKYYSGSASTSAWLHYIDGSGSVALSYNIDSVTDDDGDGFYTVNIDQNLAGGGCLVGTAHSSIDDLIFTVDFFDTTSANITIHDASSASNVDSDFSLVIVSP